MIQYFRLRFWRFVSNATALAAVLILCACGGGGGADNPAVVTPATLEGMTLLVLDDSYLPASYQRFGVESAEEFNNLRNNYSFASGVAAADSAHCGALYPASWQYERGSGVSTVKVQDSSQVTTTLLTFTKPDGGRYSREGTKGSSASRFASQGTFILVETAKLREGLFLPCTLSSKSITFTVTGGGFPAGYTKTFVFGPSGEGKGDLENGALSMSYTYDQRSAIGNIPAFLSLSYQIHTGLGTFAIVEGELFQLTSSSPEKGTFALKHASGPFGQMPGGCPADSLKTDPKYDGSSVQYIVQYCLVTGTYEIH